MKFKSETEIPNAWSSVSPVYPLAAYYGSKIMSDDSKDSDRLSKIEARLERIERLLLSLPEPEEPVEPPNPNGPARRVPVPDFLKDV